MLGATVQFGCPADASWPDGLRAIDGVHEVRRRADRVEIVGDRRMIAYVCAELVAGARFPMTFPSPCLTWRTSLGRPDQRPRQRRDGSAPMSTFAKLVRSELRLVLRKPLVLTFAFAFPIVTVW